MKSMSRRDALKSAAAIAVGGAVAAATASTDVLQAQGQTKRWGMCIDLRRCLGCKACAVACKAENDVPLGKFRRRVRSQVVGHYPYSRRQILPMSCNHCTKPKCLEACPEDAIYKDSEGFVLVDRDKCEGKKRCVAKCPYGNIYAFKFDGRNAKADKCTFCKHRVSKGVLPACAQTCVGGAITFGDIGDPKSDISKLIRDEGAIQMKPEAGTNPSFYYIGLEFGSDTALARRTKPTDLEGDR